jgi:DinB superfamily
MDLTDIPEYTRTYFEKVGEENAIVLMRKNRELLGAFYKSIPAEKWDYAYADGKWTVKEVLSHLIDSERVFQYRALRFSRNDHTELPGYDEGVFAAAGHANHRTPQSLIEEYFHVRDAGLYLFENLNVEELSLGGKANGNFVRVDWIAYMITGHEMHHVEILKERYGL